MLPAAAAATPGGGRIRGRGCKRLSTHRSYHVSRTHADLVVFMPAVNHVEGLICRWLLWTGINACSASHFVTANAHHPPPPPLPRRPHSPGPILFRPLQHFRMTGSRSMICTSTLPIFLMRKQRSNERCYCVAFFNAVFDQ